jgi:hypothetical protein
LEKQITPGESRKLIMATKTEAERRRWLAADKCRTFGWWIDEKGEKHTFATSSVNAPVPTRARSSEIKSNGRSIGFIMRAAARVVHTCDLLIDTIDRGSADALPSDLPGYMQKLLASIPGEETIKTEIVAPRPRKAKAKG